MVKICTRDSGSRSWLNLVKRFSAIPLNFSHIKISLWVGLPVLRDQAKPAPFSNEVKISQLVQLRVKMLADSISALDSGSRHIAVLQLFCEDFKIVAFNAVL
jgi:hypothetical protein